MKKMKKKVKMKIFLYKFKISFLQEDKDTIIAQLENQINILNYQNDKKSEELTKLRDKEIELSKELNDNRMQYWELKRNVFIILIFMLLESRIRIKNK